MKTNNQNLSNIVKKHLMEMAMDLPPGSEPHPDITRKLATGDTGYKSEHLPQTDRPDMNFQELLASDRYKQVIEKLSHYVGRDVRLRTIEDFLPLRSLALNALRNILMIEAQHKEQLEQLAVELVKEQMGIPDDAFIFDAKLIQMGELGAQIQQQQQQPEQEINIQGEEDLLNRLENLDLEKAKRRFINGMVQGSAKRGHYMFHYVEDKLVEITGSDTLVNNYGIVMSINDASYWQAGDDMIDMMMKMDIGQAGEEEVDRNTEPPTIKARGVMFPVLVHELIKGVMEIFALQGLPEVGAEEVLKSEDLPEKEIWDLRLGPSIWDRVREQFPEEILIDENKKELQNYLLTSIFSLPANEFIVFMMEVLKGTEEGKQFINQLMDGINQSFNNQDYAENIENLQNNIQEVTNETSEEDINNFLESLGIGRSQEESEPESEKSMEDIDNATLSGMGLNRLNFEMNKAIDAGNWELVQKIQAMIDRKQGNQ